MSDARRFIRIERPIDHVALITIDRTERMNALSFDTVVPLREAFKEVGADNDTWVAILTGAGNGFCSGLDLEDSGMPPGTDGLTLPGIAIRAMEFMSELVLGLRAMPQPVIAAVNGPAIGGGMCLSLGADIRLASTSAYFRNAGINNGLSGTEMGIGYLLPRAIGSSRAFEIILSGRDVDAAEAERIGLVSRTVEDDQLLPACLELATRICGFSTQGVQLTKRALWAEMDLASLESAVALEDRNQLFIRLTTNNLDEAIRARREGRPPNYVD